MSDITYGEGDKFIKIEEVPGSGEIVARIERADGGTHTLDFKAAVQDMNDISLNPQARHAAHLASLGIKQYKIYTPA